MAVSESATKHDLGVTTLGSDDDSDGDNVVDLLDDNEDDRKPAAKNDDYDDKDFTNYAKDNGDEDASDEEDYDGDYDVEDNELILSSAEDYVAAFLAEDKNFYEEEEGDYHGDVCGVDQTLIVGGPKKTGA